MTRPLRRARGEEGASLVLALAFMSLFGVFAGLLAQFGAASFKTTTSVRDQRAATYAAQGAVDTAIQYVRGNTALGQNGGTCLTNFKLGTVNGQDVTATCTGQVPNTGGVAASLPPQALLTTATGGEDGITVNLGTLKTSGGVFSNSTITGGFAAVDAGSSPVTARGSCTGFAFSVSGNPVTCNVGAGGHPEGNDPNYPSPLTTLPAHQTVPACPAAANKVVWLTPGFYDDDAGLNNLTNGGCHNAVLWFQPGKYYFDFDWMAGDSTHTWNLNDGSVNVVGGTPKGWNTSQSQPTHPSIPSPGACKTDTDPAPNDGVQFVFGGDSNVSGWSTNIELCATPDANGRELAIYGQGTGSLTPTPATLDPPLGGAGYTGLSSWPAPAASALTLLDKAYTTSSSVGRNASASITTRGYPTGSLPSLAAFGSVTMTIQHKESVPTNVASLTAQVTANGTACGTLTLTPSSSDKKETFTGAQLPCINDLSDLANLTVKYTGKVTNKNGASSTFSLDGVEFGVTYTPPAVRAESGCVAQPGGCDLVFLSSNFTGSFYVNGTVYAPDARFTLELGGVFAWTSTRVQMNRGVVLRSVVIFDAPIWNPSQPPTITVPPSGRTVAFVGNVGGQRRVRALVDITDNPTPGSNVDVTSWSVTR